MAAAALGFTAAFQAGRRRERGWKLVFVN